MDSAAQCPLCGKPNECGAAAGKSVCWCRSTVVPAEAIDRVPEDLRGQVCVCESCAQAAQREASARQGSSGISKKSTLGD